MRSSAAAGGGSVRMSAALRATPQRYASDVAMRLLPAAVCALGAHALLYGSFRPADGAHGYLGWYEPALALAAIAALVLIRPVALRSRLPIGDTARALATRALRCALDRRRRLPRGRGSRGRALACAHCRARLPRDALEGDAARRACRRRRRRPRAARPRRCTAPTARARTAGGTVVALWCE